MNNKKHILAFALSIATTVSALHPRYEDGDEIETQISQLQKAASEQSDDGYDLSIIRMIPSPEASVTPEISGIQAVVKNFESEQLQRVSILLTEISLEQAQAMNLAMHLNRSDITEGFAFEFGGKGYIIKATDTKYAAGIVPSSR